MAHLLIKIMAKVQLPKSAGGAVAETLKAHATLGRAVAAFQADMIVPEWLVEQHADDAEPAPAPKRRGRKPRAALGSSPLATPQQDDAETMARQYEEIRNRKPPRFTPTTTGIDGLSPEAGADPGPIPEIMRK